MDHPWNFKSVSVGNSDASLIVAQLTPTPAQIYLRPRARAFMLVNTKSEKSGPVLSETGTHRFKSLIRPTRLVFHYLHAFLPLPKFTRAHRLSLCTSLSHSDFRLFIQRTVTTVNIVS